MAQDSAWRHVWVKATPKPGNKVVKVSAIAGSQMKWLQQQEMDSLLQQLEAMELVPDVCDKMSADGWQWMMGDTYETATTQPIWFGMWRRKWPLTK